MRFVQGRASRLAVLIVGAVLGGVVLAFVAYYVVFTGTLAALNLVVWAIVAIWLGTVLRSWTATVVVTGVLGFAIVFTYSLLGYAGAAPIIHAIPAFVVISIVGAGGMALGGTIGNFGRRLVSRRRSSASRRLEQ